MSEEDKSKPTQPKDIPKDAQVIMAIMKEMGITDYEPNTIVQLTKLLYRYATSISEGARMYANNSKKKCSDVDDVRRLPCESTFTTPLPKEVLLELAQAKNCSPLPPVKPRCGLSLPPDRYCLSSRIYSIRKALKEIGKKTNTPVSKQTVTIPKPVTKINTQPQKKIPKPKIRIIQNMQFVPVYGMKKGSNNLKRKREDESENETPVSEKTVTIPKPVTKINTQPQKTVPKPKIQIILNVQIAPANGMGIDSNNLKSKREDESENETPVSKQTVTIPKLETKINTQPQKTVPKPKIQIILNVQVAPANGMGIDSNNLKRKREDESENEM